MQMSPSIFFNILTSCYRIAANHRKGGGKGGKGAGRKEVREERGRGRKG
jgi:hypothetical protein